MNQEKLIQALAAKDGRGFAVLYDHYATSLYSVIFNIIREDKRAHEVLKQVLDKASDRIDAFDVSKERLFTWLVRMARDEARIQIPNSAEDISQNFLTMESDNPTERFEPIVAREFARKLKPRCVQAIEILFFRGTQPEQAAVALQVPVESLVAQNRQCINDLRNYLKP